MTERNSPLLETFRVSSGGADDGSWIIVGEGDLKGMTLIADKDTGSIVRISARQCSDTDRPSIMPSLEKYSSLQVLDLHGYRHVKCLHDSVGNLTELKRLILTECSLLSTLPLSLGNLHKLIEVSCCVHLLSFGLRIKDVSFTNA